jgi:hypothetical protein
LRSASIRGLHVERSATWTEQVDDPAGKIEQRPPRLPRRQNPQCRPLIEAYHLTGVFEANGGSAPWAHENRSSRAHLRQLAGHYGLDRAPDRTDDENFTLCRDYSAGRDLAPGLRGGAERQKSGADQQHE